MSARLPPALALLAALAPALAGCASLSAQPAPAWTTPSEGVKDATSGTPVEVFFPLVDGNVYQYVTTNESGDRGLLVARVHRADAQHGELRLPNGVKRFEFTAAGLVLHDRGDTAMILKAPLQLGASWRGEHGGQTSVLSLTATAEVPAGRYDGCLQTREERLGDRPIRYTTTYCPGIGVVIIEASGGASLETAELKSYGPPMAVGPDGLQRVP